MSHQLLTLDTTLHYVALTADTFTDAEVKEFIVNDNEQMKIICSMSVVDANTAYSVGCMVMNMTNR